MTTLTELVAAVVVHSSAVALSHFGVTMEAAQADRPAPSAERVVARTPTHRHVLKTTCPELRHRARAIKV